MNTYKVNFQRENGTTGFDYFTAPTEAQARKAFNEVYRHGNGEITSVVLTSSDTPATKEQERKALEKIKKIVAELGELSYIGIALEGCLEDAANNIENDFGNSMKSRYEDALKQLEEKRVELEKAESVARHVQSKLDKADEELENVKKSVLSHESLSMCVGIVREFAAAKREMADNYAKQIVEYAEHPESTEFMTAVSANREFARKANDAEFLAKKLLSYGGNQ